MRRLVLSVVLLAAGSASAMGGSIEGAAGYWFEGAPQFQLTLAAHQALGKYVRIGVRSGVALNLPGGAPTVGIPVDVGLRIRFQRVFLEPLGGLWFLLGRSDFLRAHAGIAVGFIFGPFDLSLEASWLQPSALLLARFSFHF